MKRLNEKPVGRWAINIDLEGFGHLYDRENLVLLSLGELMEGIFRVGTQYYPESPDRIFAHQIGDGFVIVSDFPEETFRRPVAIALSLLRHVAHSGRYAKATISDGICGYSIMLSFICNRNSGDSILISRRVLLIGGADGIALPAKDPSGDNRG